MALILNDIGFKYTDHTILKDFNLEVSNQQFLSILGPSGCGKSTILKVMAGILPMQKGMFAIDGEIMNGIHPKIAYMPQEDLLLEWETVFQNVTLYQRIHKQTIDKQAVYEKIERFGLKGFENHYPHQLSGGMRQRVAFLRTALCDAEILLLDEPFGSLDVISRHEMQDWLQGMRKEMNKTIILVSHDLDEALYLSDRIVVMDKGSVGESFEIREAYRDRSWLFKQTALRERLYHCLKGEPHAD